jgi:hypothetical protein
VPSFILSEDERAKVREKLKTILSEIRSPEETHAALVVALKQVLSYEGLKNKLAAELRRAITLGAAPNDTGPNQRRTCVAQLGAVRGFFGAIGLDEDLTRPLSEVMAALADAERGVRNPLLQARKSEGGRPPAKLMPALDLANAAAAMTRAMDSGRSSKDAAKQVVSALRARGHKNVTPGALKRFRTSLTSAEHMRASGEARKHKKTIVHAKNLYEKALKHTAGMPPDTAIEFILDCIGTAIAKTP